MVWKAESIEGVWFIAPEAVSRDANQLWMALFGNSPDSFNRPAGFGALAPSTASGRSGSYHLTLNAQPGRADLHLAQAVGALGPPERIGDIGAGLDYLVGLISKSIENSPVTRLAIHVNASDPAPNPHEAATRASSLVKSPPLPPLARDFSFQINVQTQSAVTSVVLNRICRWSSAVQQMISLQIGAPSNGQTAPLVVGESDIVLFNLDVNNAHSPTPLATSDAQTVLTELAREAKALLAEGYERFDVHAH